MGGANERKRRTGLPIQPARSEQIIKHNRDREPSGGEGGWENGTVKLMAKTQKTRAEKIISAQMTLVRKENTADGMVSETASRSGLDFHA